MTQKTTKKICRCSSKHQELVVTYPPEFCNATLYHMWCKQCGRVGQLYTTEESARKYWKDDRKLNIQPSNTHTLGQIQKDQPTPDDILNELANINKTGQEIASLLRDLMQQIDNTNTSVNKLFI